MPIAWSRPEPFGAWIRLDDATLVAVDNALAARLQVPHGYAPPGAARPLELHVAVTSRCPLPCDGCYLDARPDGDEPPIEAIIARLEAAATGGVSLVAFGGGEPLTRRDLDRIAAEARRLRLVPVLTTSGVGLTEARAWELRGFAQINVSHDGAGDGYAAVRGFDGRAIAEQAIRALTAAGIPTGVNMVLTSGSFPALEATCDLIADLGAVEVQLLRYKPAGRGADPGYAGRRLTTAQVDALWPAIARIVAAGRIRVRIDCAMVPLISRGLLAAVEDAPRALAALGVFGCEAGRNLGAMRVDGSGAPCSLFSVETGGLIQIGSGHARTATATATATATEAIAATVTATDAATATDAVTATDAATATDAVTVTAAATATATARLRAYHTAPLEPCASCALLQVCRGGCQIVSLHAGAGFAPDPECPRVLEHM